MTKRGRPLIIIMLVTVLAHMSIYLSGDAPDSCEPRVIIKRELVTATPTTPEPPPLAPPPPKPSPNAEKKAPELESKSCKCDENKADPDLRGHGMLYKDIKPTKFNPSQRKTLFILGYQRVGSSFFGQMFDENPHFFYIYEPLDAIYTGMFGTRGGLNVPGDITFHSNGTARRLTTEEDTKIVQLLTSILSCDVDRLPREFMLHRFWDYLVESYMPSWLPYRSCLEETGVLTAREECRTKHLGPLCPERLGLNVSDQTHCRKEILDLAKYGRHSGPKIQPFIKYEDCVIAAFEKGKKCVDIYKQKCKQARLWSTKTVRATMQHAEKMMASDPNMRLIHLIRDPRPVVTSRSMDSSYRSIYSGVQRVEGGDKAKEAVVYCGTLMRDLRYRQQLEKQFPGRIIQVIYEDFVQNPGEYAKAIYAFLDENVPDELLPWIKSQTEGDKWKNNAMVRMNGWKNGMTFKEGERVQLNCKDFYKMIQYPWPY